MVGYRVTGTDAADTGKVGITIDQPAIISASKVANDLLRNFT